jgi:hypothetical protein
MKSNILIHRILPIILLSSLVLSACQPPALATPDPMILQQTLAAMVGQTLTAVPTSTPLPTPTSTPLPTLTPTPGVVSYGPTNFPADVDPMTGLKVADPTILDRRPVMIKVANFPREGRPHAGLSFADIVFDYYTGQGANRFVALFYGQDTKQAGPVRSGRLIDPLLVRMYQGILGMEYAYGPVLNEIIKQLGSRVIYSDHCPAICSDGLETEVSRFANTAEFSKYYSSKTSATNFKPNLDGMVFNSAEPEIGVNAQEFTMHYGKNNDAQWKYDSLSGKYLRFIDEINANGEETMIPLIDRLTSKQLAFSNVIVIYEEIETMNGDNDTIHQHHITGVTGRALIFRNGKMIDAFYKGMYDTPIQFMDKDKNPIALQPGNTWIHFTGLASHLTEDQPGVWLVVLRKP